MSDYPALSQYVGSVEDQKDDILVSRSRSGLVKARRIFSSRRSEFTVVHKNLSSADKATLQAHYDANRSNAFNFAWTGDGVTYSVIYGGSLKWVPSAVARWDVTVLLLVAN